MNSLEKYKLRALKDFAKSLELPRYSTMKKNELIYSLIPILIHIDRSDPIYPKLANNIKKIVFDRCYEVSCPDDKICNNSSGRCIKRKNLTGHNISKLPKNKLFTIYHINSNQQVNQHVNQDVNQQVNQHVNQDVNQDVNQHVNQDVNQDVNQQASSDIPKGENGDECKYDKHCISGYCNSVLNICEDNGQHINNVAGKIKFNRLPYYIDSGNGKNFNFHVAKKFLNPRNYDIKIEQLNKGTFTSFNYSSDVFNKKLNNDDNYDFSKVSSQYLEDIIMGESVEEEYKTNPDNVVVDGEKAYIVENMISYWNSKFEIIDTESDRVKPQYFKDYYHNLINPFTVYKIMHKYYTSSNVNKLILHKSPLIIFYSNPKLLIKVYNVARKLKNLEDHYEKVTPEHEDRFFIYYRRDLTGYKIIKDLSKQFNIIFTGTRLYYDIPSGKYAYEVFLSCFMTFLFIEKDFVFKKNKNDTYNWVKKRPGEECDKIGNRSLCRQCLHTFDLFGRFLPPL